MLGSSKVVRVGVIAALITGAFTVPANAATVPLDKTQGSALKAQRQQLREQRERREDEWARQRAQAAEKRAEQEAPLIAQRAREHEQTEFEAARKAARQRAARHAEIRAKPDAVSILGKEFDDLNRQLRELDGALNAAYQEGYDEQAAKDAVATRAAQTEELSRMARERANGKSAAEVLTRAQQRHKELIERRERHDEEAELASEAIRSVREPQEAELQRKKDQALVELETKRKQLAEAAAAAGTALIHAIDEHDARIAILRSRDANLAKIDSAGETGIKAIAAHAQAWIERLEKEGAIHSAVLKQAAASDSALIKAAAAAAIKHIEESQKRLSALQINEDDDTVDDSDLPADAEDDDNELAPTPANAMRSGLLGLLGRPKGKPSHHHPHWPQRLRHRQLQRANLVKRMADALARKRIPYGFGGGHGGSKVPEHPSRIDCSATVCWVLQHAGYRSLNTTDSTGLMRWGHPGRGKYITVWSNPAHTFLEIKGRFFGTNTSSWRHGPGWHVHPTRGFTPRHPKGQPTR